MPEGLFTANNTAAGSWLPRFEELASGAEAAQRDAPRPTYASAAASQGEDKAKIDFVINAASKGTAWFQDATPLHDDLRACVDWAKSRSCQQARQSQLARAAPHAPRGRSSAKGRPRLQP